MSQNLLSAVIVIGTLRVNLYSATIIFVLKMLSAIYVCSIYSSALQASLFMEAKTISPD